MEKRNLNEELKKQELEEAKQLKERQGKDGEMTLDDTQRVKVLSPGRLVFNRFIRNKLAIVGSIILVFMFTFAFLCPIFYPYRQTEIFYKYDNVVVDYAQASKRTEYSVVLVPDKEIDRKVKISMNAYIKEMQGKGLTEMPITDDAGNSYLLKVETEGIYGFYQDAKEEVCSMGGFSAFATYSTIGSKFTYQAGNTAEDGFEAAAIKAVDNGEDTFTFGDNEYSISAGKKKSYNIEKRSVNLSYVGTSLGEDFEAKLNANIDQDSFEYNNKTYRIVTSNDSMTVYVQGEQERVAYLTTYVFDTCDSSFKITEEFKAAAIEAACGEGKFSIDSVSYQVNKNDDETVIYANNDKENPIAVFSELAVRAYTGEDTMDFAFKEKLREVIDDMSEKNTLTGKFEWDTPEIGSDGSYVLDENGNTITVSTDMTVKNKNGSYVVSCEQMNYLIDIYAAPSKAHLVGTDGDGMDVLARMMYGGRVSLLVCFVVIIIETFLGVIMGGIAGYFGGWIDNLIMRLVDIFYCIPSLPILIILGALFDAMKLPPYVRLVWLMVVLGILGWAGVARLVRGQILSLREQEFMVAAEAIGLRTKRRIFKHLIPNVMPQLIVTASSGLGSIIITESTLSFLGLGVKHPVATWGTMINSVTGATENMIKYAYVWVPVGLLICLTVVAFNFVGDGLRDAFDPKMKR